jgi:hypothetical protein
MKSHMNIKSTLPALLILFIVFSTQAQNTVITDSDSYIPHNSAMLDVYSLSKGLLVPRLTSTQRIGISAPADGLLVYDTDADTYYYYANSAWHTIDAPSLWSESVDTVYIAGSNKRIGVGTSNPFAKLTVQGDAAMAPDEPLFEVKNSAGDVIFAVYENEVKVNFKESAKGIKGGFAVGGLTGNKSEPTEYLRITPDSVRIYINDMGTKGIKGGFAVGGLTGSKGSGDKYFMINDDSARIYLKTPAKGIKGGFAVGGLTGNKGGTEQYMTIERDSTRVYINDAAKGIKGGFAVGGLTGSKGGTNKYLTIERDSARIYVDESAKGIKGGFAVGGLTGSKATGTFMNMTPENYFIGKNAGVKTQPSDAPLQGKYNQFFGYEAGLNNLFGLYNILIGYQSGYTGQAGNYNTFMGYQAGYANTGSDNTFIGYLAGSSHLNQGGNVYIGSKAGESATNGEQNIFIGESAGTNNTYGKRNVFMGFKAGFSTTGNASIAYMGSYNVFIGNESGLNNKTGYNNIAMGEQTGKNLNAGSTNVLLGAQAGFENTDGSGNIFIGTEAGYKNNGNPYDMEASENIYIGINAAHENVLGWRNICIGNSAAFNMQGSQNIIMGIDAAKNKTSGQGNVVIGNNAGNSSGTSSNCVFLGSNAGYYETSSNRLHINNGQPLDDPLIYGEFDNGLVRINGENSASTDIAFDVDAGGAVRFRVDHNGYIWMPRAATLNVGVAAADFKISSSGLVGISGSSIRYKKDVVDMQDINWLYKLRPVNFLYKTDDTETLQYGLIAEEVEKINKSFVFYNNEGEVETVTYSLLITPLIKATQDQKKIIDSQEVRISKLEEEIKKLKELINK